MSHCRIAAINLEGRPGGWLNGGQIGQYGQYGRRRTAMAVTETKTSPTQMASCAPFACFESSALWNPTTALISIARAADRLTGSGRVHTLKRQSGVGMLHRPENRVDHVLRKSRHRLEQHTVRCVFNRGLCSRRPMMFVADGLGKVTCPKASAASCAAAASGRASRLA